LIETMGAKGMSRSEVSRMAKELDTEVTAFRERPLDGPWTKPLRGRGDQRPSSLIAQ